MRPHQIELVSQSRADLSDSSGGLSRSARVQTLLVSWGELDPGRFGSCAQPLIPCCEQGLGGADG